MHKAEQLEMPTVNDAVPSGNYEVWIYDASCRWVYVTRRPTLLLAGEHALNLQQRERYETRVVHRDCDVRCQYVLRYAGMFS